MKTLLIVMIVMLLGCRSTPLKSDLADTNPPQANGTMPPDQIKVDAIDAVHLEEDKMMPRMGRTCKVEPRLCKTAAADLTPNEAADIHRARLKFEAAVKTATQAGNELNDLLYAALKARKMDDDHLPASVRGEKDGEGMAFLTDDEHQHGMGTWGTCRGQIAFVNDKIIVFTPDPEIDKCQSDLSKLRNQ